MKKKILKSVEKKNPKSKNALSLFPTGNFQTAITFEPIDVDTSDKVFWTFQATHHKIPSEIANRGGGEVFSAWSKEPVNDFSLISK